ncbi:ABC transporter permease [Rubritalea marina]|uniref:ABC transporter permease n=1 Tax=Rubritalea marina TaxID=361055 RepID=UPI000377C7A6|nr:ABC transporter permease [Rubritalea marina]
MVTSILSLLALLVLVFFAESKYQLQKKLSETNSLRIYLADRILPSEATTQLIKSRSEEEMWHREFPTARLSYFRQTFQFVQWKDNRAVPVIAYSSKYPSLSIHDAGEAPNIWLLSTSPQHCSPIEEITSDRTTLYAKPIAMDDDMQLALGTSSAIAIPEEMAIPFFTAGFYTHIIASFGDIDTATRFEAATSAYYAAERRSPRKFNSLGIIAEVEKLNQLQTQIRIGIVLTCGLISALIIGAIAWLEFRQESYLLALLRSFGTPRFILLIHGLCENAVLTGLGIFIAFKSWPLIYNILIGSVNGLQLRAAEFLTLPQLDMAIIIAASAVGVLLAMIPVAVGLRKPAGLILQ